MKKSILVVDDDVSLLEAIASSLETHGFVSRACSAEDAAKYIGSSLNLDLLVTDLNVPYPKSGFDIISMAKHKFMNCSVILMSGHLTDGDRALASRLDVGICLEKPFSRDVFLSHATWCLERDADSTARTLANRDE